MKCDICHKEVEEYVDGRTIMGPWANMCLPCHSDNGVGFGTGLGQKYPKVVDKKPVVEDLTFDGWMKQLDDICSKKLMMGIHDFRDMCYRDAYDNGVTAQEFFDEDVVSMIEEEYGMSSEELEL